MTDLISNNSKVIILVDKSLNSSDALEALNKVGFNRAPNTGFYVLLTYHSVYETSDLVQAVKNAMGVLDELGINIESIKAEKIYFQESLDKWQTVSYNRPVNCS